MILKIFNVDKIYKKCIKNTSSCNVKRRTKTPFVTAVCAIRMSRQNAWPNRIDNGNETNENVQSHNFMEI